MNLAFVGSNNNQADGLRAVSVPSEALPDLCHHTEYRIYLDGTYIESVGNLGGNAQRALEFYRRKRQKQAVEIKAMPCRLPGCTWRQS